MVGQDTQTIGLKGLKVPLEYYPDGTVKAMLKAEVSTVDSTGQNIKAEGLRYETYAEGGSTDVVITAEECFYDKANGTAKSDSRVTLERGGVLIKGKGFNLDAERELISLHSDVVVKFKRTLGGKERKK